MPTACSPQDDPDSSHARRIDAKAQHLAAAIAFPVAGSDVVDRLTPREIEITAAAIRGRSSRAIAGQEFLSVRTVDNHLRRVYRKLDIGGRGELAAVLGHGSAEDAGPGE